MDADLFTSTDRPFLSYLEGLSDELIQQLYESRPCVIAIFRILPPFAQKCVLQLLFQKSTDWRSWVRKRFQLVVFNSLQLLSRLRILEGDLASADFQLNIDFRMNYISSLLSTPLELSELRLHPLDEKSRNAADKDLLGKSVERWESILCYLALPSDAAYKSVSETTRSLFQYIGLIRGNVKEPEISSTGFQFLLMSRTEQIWAYLICYMRFLASRGDEVYPVLEFLLRLTLCISPDETVRPLVLDPNWPQHIQEFVATLRELGLIFIRKRKDGWFLLTPLMTQLAQSASDATAEQNTASDGAPQSSAVAAAASGNRGSANRRDGFLVVETNYRVYAYTNSTLQLAILSTFTELMCRFQDIAIGTLTRDSIRRALQTGITARQITQYLSANMKACDNDSQAAQRSSGGPQLPVTVAEQIYLWEQERKRFVYTDGTLFSNFDSEADYIAMKDFVSEQRLALWHCNVGKMLIVSADGEDLVKEWWAEYRAGLR